MPGGRRQNVFHSVNLVDGADSTVLDPQAPAMKTYGSISTPGNNSVANWPEARDALSILLRLLHNVFLMVQVQKSLLGVGIELSLVLSSFRSVPKYVPWLATALNCK